MTEEETEPEPGEKESIPESGEGAQESDGEKKEEDPATEKTEDTEEPGEAKKPVENPEAEGQDGITEQEPAAEEEGTDITDSNGVQPEKQAVPQKAVRAASAAVQEGDIASGEGWAIDSTGKLTIESDAGMENWYKDSGDSFSTVKMVEIEEGVTSLLDDAFGDCTELTSITIPTSVTSIGTYTFGGCSSLTSIVIPNSVTSIGEIAFTGCASLTEITIPDSVTSIGGFAFMDCSELASVTMLGSEPPALGEMSGQKKQFTGCKFETEKAKGIKVPAETATAYKAAWEEWAEYITDGTDDTGDDIIAFDDGWRIDSTGKLTIESAEGMNRWQNGGRKDHADKVKSAEIKMNSDSPITTIGSVAFLKCSSLTSITIADSVESIGDRAFKECSALENIKLSNKLKSMGIYVFENCSGLADITIPDSVESIGEWAFNGCSNLRKVKLPSGIASIESCMFYGCKDLTSITIPESVTSIGGAAFNGCSNLTGITIPNSVTSIGVLAFSGCSNLTAITIPGNVTSIGYKAFKNCSGLESVTMERNTPPTLDVSESGTTDHFAGCKFVTDNAKGIKVPAGTAAEYKAAWTEWQSYITDGTGDTEGEFKPVTGKSWRIDENRKLTIDSDAGMEDWSKNGTQNYAKDVQSVEINSSVTSIGEYAFYESKITSITIPDSVIAVGRYAFGKCSTLTSITIPNNVKTIGDHLFSGCTSLSEVTLPAGMESIGDGMFDSCSDLKGITIPESVKSIGAWAFDGCGLETLTIPSGVTEIKYGAFRGCKGLTAITIPANVTSIGYMVFKDCSKLETVTMKGDTPPTLGASGSGIKDHFTGCKFVTDDTEGVGIKVPAGTAAVYKAAWEEWQKYIAEGSAPVIPDTPTDEEKVAAAKKAVEAALADIKVSNTTTQESLAAAIQDAVNAALEAAGINSKDVTVEVKDFAKKLATTEAAGSITANITITSGTESASVPVNQPIDKLPDTPADQVAAVKKAVEEALQDAIDKALAGTTVTNENAQEIVAKITELIPDAIAGAFEAAGVGTDAITVGELAIQIEAADADKEGSIQVTIPLTSNADASLSENASVQVPVMKPGGEENPGQEAEAAKKAVEEALKNIPVTNETTPEDILASLKEALGEDVAVEGIEELAREDATQDAPGKLTLKIKLIINGQVVYVTVDLSIAQLARKTGVYVRFTDTYQMEGSTPVYKYTGLAIKPAVEVYNNETLLTLGKDYTLGYKNNTKPGTAAALTVRGKGSFSGTSNAVNFQIINADIKNDTDHPTEMTVIQNTKVSPVIMNGTKKLTTKDYELEGEGLVNSKYAAPTAEGETNTLTVKGKGSYAGSSFEIKVKVIERKAAGKLAVKVDSKFKPVYDGTALHLSSLFQKPQEGEGTETAAEGQEPAGVITVTDAKDKTKILKEGTDFTVVCTSSLTNAGTVKFTLTGMGAYTGSVTKSFKISPHKVTDNSRFSVTFDEAKTYEYRAAGTEVDGLLVKYLGETEAETDDKILIPGVDYKVTYSNHKKVSGTKDAGLKVTFLGNYKGSSAVQKTFKIAPAKLSSANTVVTVPDKVYSKGNRTYKSTPIVTVDGAVIKSSQYTVSYEWATASQAADDTKYVEDNRVKITIAEGDTWAKVRVTVTPKEKGSYGLAEGAVLRGEYYVRKADQAVNLTKARVTFFDKAGTQLSGLAYNGDTFYTPAGNNAEAENAPDDPNAVYVRVTVSGAVVDPTLYEVTWTNATAKGKATVVIRGTGTATDKGMAVGSKNQSVTIKAMALKGKTLKSYVEGMADVMNSLKDLFF